MDCNKANDYFMKYMDNLLSEPEMNELEKHFETCKACKEDFSVYNEVMSDFSEMEMFNAPGGFEEAVMLKINELPDIKSSMANSLDNLFFWAFGLFSVLIGTNFVFAINKYRIIDFLYSVPELYVVADFFVSLSDYVTRFSGNMIQVVNDTLYSVSDLLSSARYVLLGVFVVLGIVQLILYKKDKVEA